MPLINVKTAFYLNEILFNLSINTKVLFMACPKTLDNKDIHLPMIAATFIFSKLTSASTPHQRQLDSRDV